jgi:DNA-binding GntR family transcriptional regulator
MPEGPTLTTLQSSHLKDVAYEAIREALTDLTLPPGASISENWLVSQLGISKTPIRHALTRLEQEGLVETIPFKGTFAAASREEDARDLLELRIVLERAAAARVAQGASPEDLDQLRQLAIDGASAEAAGEHSDAMRRIGDFHIKLVHVAGSPWLSRSYDALGGPLDRLRSISSASGSSIEDSTVEHLAIVDALANGDGSLASDLLEAHTSRILALYMAGKAAAADASSA